MDLPPLTIYKFIFNLEALEDMKLPQFKGSMFRGAFGWSFRKSVCVTKKPDCEGCILQQQCSYFKIFETEVPENNIWFLQGVKKVPHPFVIHPPLEERCEYKNGEVLEVGLTIFGSAINSFPFFVYNFQQMGIRGISYKRSKFRLSSVYNISQENNKYLVYQENRKSLKNDYAPISIKNILSNDKNNSNKIKIEFITPFRFQRDGNIISNPNQLTAPDIINAIQRRYFAISKLFCDASVNDYPPYEVIDDIILEENKLYFYNWNRYSSRQKTKIALGGFKGSLILSGNLNNILPLLQIGEKINIGKNTVFGLGEYKVFSQ